MRRAVLALVIGLAGCAAPVGTERDVCAAEWLDVTAVVARGGDGVGERPLPIECMRKVALRRVEVGFSLPAGPDCWLLQRVELQESADAVSVRLIGAVDADPNVGACSDQPRRAQTEIDLQAPVGRRVLLDGFEEEAVP